MVVLGRVIGAYGVSGWVKVEAFSQSPQTLLEHGTWHARRPGSTGWQARAVSAARMQGQHVVAHLAEVLDRDAASALKGWEIGVPRAALPPVAQDEIYWADLVGLEVVNREGRTLGTVRAVAEYGAHPVLQVTPVEAGSPERLVPWVAAVVDAVDVAARRIEVDWGEDY